MKRTLQIIIIVLLLAVVIIQVLSLTNKLFPGARQTVCPVNAITMIHGKAVIDSIKCIGCRRCVDGFVAIPDQEFYLPGGLLQADAKVVEQMNDEPAPIAIEPAKTAITPAKHNKANKQDSQVDLQRQQESVISAGKDVESDDSSEQSGYQVVDTQSCISCGLCLRVCPEGAISYVDGKALIDPEKCTNCGICTGLEPGKFKGCPVGAIHSATN